MKRLIAIILTLSVVLAPIGTAFCFEDDTVEAMNTQIAMKAKGIDKAEMIIDVDKNDYTVKVNCYKSDGTLVDTSVNDDKLKENLNKLNCMKAIQSKLQNFKKSYRVKLMVGDLINIKESPVKLNIYDRSGKLINSFKWNSLKNIPDDAIGSKIDETAILEKAKNKAKVEVAKKAIKAQAILEGSRLKIILVCISSFMPLFLNSSFAEVDSIFVSFLAIVLGSIAGTAIYKVATLIIKLFDYEGKMIRIDDAYKALTI